MLALWDRLRGAAVYYYLNIKSQGQAKARKLEKAIQVFSQKVSDKNQPALKLNDATVHAVRQRPINQMMTDLEVIDSVPAIPRDRRVILGGRKAKTEAEYLYLRIVLASPK